MDNKKNPDKQIAIHGELYDASLFRPQYFEESEINPILRAIEEVGEYAGEGNKNIEKIVRSSPLFHIEGLIRYQFLENKIEDHGIGLENLETTSDFLFEKDFFHNQVNCYKLVFLFNFLWDVVFLSETPKDINPKSLDKIAMNLRTLHILCESTYTGKESHKESVGFRHFAYSVWVGMGAKEKISGQQFWNRVISILENEKYEREAEVSILRCLHWGQETERVDYIARLETEKEKKTIRIICESGNMPNERAKGEGQVKKIWANLRKDFIKSYRIKGYSKK